jgi:hypothetical protein
MKKPTNIILALLVVIIGSSCDSDDDSPTRAVDRIEIFIDNSTTPIAYSTNIVATDMPIDPSTGFNCVFLITSEDTSTNNFTLNFAPNVAANCPTTIITPVFVNLIGSEISIINIQGLDINYSDSRNFITINYTVFGNNIGDTINIDFNGKYYDSLGVMHPIIGIIEIHRS